LSPRGAEAIGQIKAAEAIRHALGRGAALGASSRIEIDSNTVVRSGEVRWQPALCAWIQLDRIANDKRPYR
jgi:hypothetical protein